MKPLAEILDVPLETRLFQLPEETGLSWDEMNKILENKPRRGFWEHSALTEKQLENLNSGNMPAPQSAWNIISKIANLFDRYAITLYDNNASVMLQSDLSLDPRSYSVKSLRSHMNQESITLIELSNRVAKSISQVRSSLNTSGRLSTNKLELYCPALGVHYAYFVEKGYY